MIMIAMNEGLMKSQAWVDYVSDDWWLVMMDEFWKSGACYQRQHIATILWSFHDRFFTLPAMSDNNGTIMIIVFPLSLWLLVL